MPASTQFSYLSLNILKPITPFKAIACQVYQPTSAVQRGPVRGEDRHWLALEGLGGSVDECPFDQGKNTATPHCPLSSMVLHECAGRGPYPYQHTPTAERKYLSSASIFSMKSATSAREMRTVHNQFPTRKPWRYTPRPFALLSAPGRTMTHSRPLDLTKRSWRCLSQK